MCFTNNPVHPGHHKLSFGWQFRLGIFEWECTACGNHAGLIVSIMLDSGSRDPGSSPNEGYCAVFLSKTLNSHSASIHPGPHCLKLD